MSYLTHLATIEKGFSPDKYGLGIYHDYGGSSYLWLTSPCCNDPVVFLAGDGLRCQKCGKRYTDQLGHQVVGIRLADLGNFGGKITRNLCMIAYELTPSQAADLEFEVTYINC